MVLLDARPPSLDARFRPGNAFTATFNWSSTLAGRSFTATLDAATLALAVVGDTMTITASAAQTAAAAAVGTFTLTETTGGASQVLIIGDWHSSTGPSASTSATVTVNESSGTVEVSVSGAGEVAVVADAVAALDAQASAAPRVIPAMAMRAGAGTPTLVTSANGLPGWSLDFGESVVCALPELPVDWSAIELEVIFSKAAALAGGTFAWTGTIGRVDIGDPVAAGQATRATPTSLVAASWPDGTAFSATIRHMPDGSPITATGPAADTSTNPDVLLPVADRRTALGLTIAVTDVTAGVGPFVVHEVRVRDGSYPRVLLAEDMIGSWWTRPRTTVNAAGEAFVAGAKATATGAVGEANPNARPPVIAAQATLGALEEDDHNNGALVVPATVRPPVVFYANHAIDNLLRYRVGTAVEAVTGLAGQSEQTIDMGAGVTYAEAHARPAVGSGELHVFCRAPSSAWRYVRSTDWATSWSPSVAVWNTFWQTYLASALLADGRTLRCVGFNNPGTFGGGDHHIYAWQIDLQTGDVTLVGSSTVIANVQTGVGLPLRDDTVAGGTEIAPIYETPAGRTTHVFDVSSGDTPMIVFAEKDEDPATTTNSVYKLARWDGIAWVVSTLAETGQHFGWSLGYYVGGGAFPTYADDTLYLSREHAGVWTIERHSISAGTSEVVDRADQPLVRPFAVDGNQALIDVTYYRAHRFEGFAAGEFFSDLYAIDIAAGDSALYLPGGAGNYVSTPDAASLDIVGDIDIRVDLTLDDWTTGVNRSIVSKYLTGTNQRSYRVFLNTLNLFQISCSVTGSATTFGSALGPGGFADGSRHAVRVTIDVDNGAGGYLVTWYTADTIDGPWTIVGSPAPVTDGAKSIFAGTAVLEVGAVNTGTAELLNGLVHAVEVRNGIDGTIVANPEFRDQLHGDTSFPDTATPAKTWTVNGAAAIVAT